MTAMPTNFAPEHPEATCQRCHGPNVVWYAPNVLWNQVMRPKGEGSEEWTIVCPTCFIQLAELCGLVAAWCLNIPQHRDVVAHTIMDYAQIRANIDRIEQTIKEADVRETTLIDKVARMAEQNLELLDRLNKTDAENQRLRKRIEAEVPPRPPRPDTPEPGLWR